MNLKISESSPSSNVKTTLTVAFIRAIFKIGSGILEPIMLNFNLKKQGDIGDEKRQIMVTQQAIRQGVTFFTDLSAYLGTALLSLSALKKTKNPALWGVVAGLAGEELIGNLVLRPFLMTKVTSWWDHRTDNTKPSSPPTALRSNSTITPFAYPVSPKALQIQYSTAYQRKSLFL